MKKVIIDYGYDDELFFISDTEREDAIELTEEEYEMVSEAIGAYYEVQAFLEEKRRLHYYATKIK